ncbi:uncharacterized protein [Diadema antillarum]|uniref:uncharacterized protein n=1 Tax=Diadema antillarum TaxID=105358 RepID=UPI003A8B04E8
MATSTAGSPPAVFVSQTNDDVNPTEVTLAYNVNACHGGGTALGICTTQEGSDSNTILSLIRSGYYGNHFESKLVASSSAKDTNGSSGSEFSQTDRDGNLILKAYGGHVAATLFSNQSRYTSGGHCLRRDSAADGSLNLTLREIGFANEATDEGAVSFLAVCSSSKTDESTPIACCYLVEVRPGKEKNDVTSIPVGNCGPNRLKDKWVFSSDGKDSLQITGPPGGHFAFVCNAKPSDNQGSDGNVQTGKTHFSEAYNGEHDTILLPKIKTHYGRALLLLCSRSCPVTNLTTSALYLVAPLALKTGVFCLAWLTEDPDVTSRQGVSDIWRISKKIGKLTARLQKDVTGPCRYAFISNAPEDISNVGMRSTRGSCLATGSVKPVDGELSVRDGVISISTESRQEVFIEVNGVALESVKESQFKENSGQFVCQISHPQDSCASGGLKLYRPYVCLKNKENKTVEVELVGSPVQVVCQKIGVHLAVNFGGPAYESVNGVVFEDGRILLPSICPSIESIYTGCYIDPSTNCHGVVSSTEDGALYTTYIGNRLTSPEGIHLKIAIPSGQYTLTLFTLSSGLASAVISVNGKDVSGHVRSQLECIADVSPACTAKNASIPMVTSDEFVEITIKSDESVKLSAILIHDERFPGVSNPCDTEASPGLSQELAEEVAPLDRQIMGGDVKYLGWSANLLTLLGNGSTAPAREASETKPQEEDGSSLDAVTTSQTLNLSDYLSAESMDNIPTIEFSESYRMPLGKQGTYDVTVRLEKSDGTRVDERLTKGTLSRSKNWTKAKLIVDGYGKGVRRLVVETRVSGKTVEHSSRSLRIKCRRANSSGRGDNMTDVKLAKDVKKLAGMIRDVIQRYGGGDEAGPDTMEKSQRQSQETSAQPPSLEEQLMTSSAHVTESSQFDAAAADTAASTKSSSGRGAARKKREIRVFVSSTFTDFAAERELLIKKVFGELKRMCLDRGVFFSYVDLRWGITSDQSNDGQTISICLREIDRCRPYFICLMGDRFGWSQTEDEVDELLSKSFDYAVENFSNLKWIDKHRYRCSVTQLEVSHAVFQNKDEDMTKTFFYLRQSKSKETMMAEDGHEPEWKIDQQRALRQTVIESGMPVRHYVSPEEVSALIQQDLERCIDTEFPLGSKLTPLQREREAHQSFADVRRRVYIGRSEYFEKIDEYFAGSPSMPFVILGESGSGKSALVANWCGRFEERHPDDFIFMHFIGSSADSASHFRLLRRLYEELKEHFGLDMTIPSVDKMLIQDLPKWLSVAGSFGRKVVLVLDALNQLDSGAGGTGDEQDLTWLPRELPENVFMLLSTLPGKALEAVKAAGWPVYRVQLLNSSEKGEIITCYLQLYAKALNAEQTALIVNAQQTSNALYLRALLDEVRIYGYFFKLTDAIRRYLEASDPGELFVKVLERLEADFETGENGRPHLVRDTTCAIWCCSRGMSEQELLTFLQVPSRVWSPFYLSLEENLVNRNGILNFFHDHLRQAVERKYLSSVAEKKRAYLKLADFFQTQDINYRYVEELPHLLMEANEMDRLKSVAMNPAAFQLLMKTLDGKARLVQAWRMLGGFEQAGQAYLEFVNHCSDFIETTDKAEFLDCLTDFFMELGLLKISRRLNQLRLKILEEQHVTDDSCHVCHHVRYERKMCSRHHDVIKNILDLGMVCQKLHDFSAAAAYFEDALCRLSKPTSTDQRLQMIRALAGLGQVYGVTSRGLEAHRFLLRALEIAKQILPESHHVHATLHGLIGEVYQRQGYPLRALQHHALDLQEAQRSGGGLSKPRAAVTLNNIALALTDLDSSHESTLVFFEQALAILVDAYGLDHVDVASVRLNLAMLFFNLKLYKKSLFQFKRAQSVFNVYYGTLHPKSQQAKDGLRALRPYTLS